MLSLKNKMVRLTERYRKLLSDYIECDNLCDKEYYKKFLSESYFIMLVENIENMPGHCVVAGKSGQVYTCFDTPNFEEIPEEEI